MIRKVIEKFAVVELFRSLLVWLSGQGAGRAWSAAFALVPELPQPNPAVAVIVDERLNQVMRSLKRTSRAIAVATSSIVGLGGTSGPGALVSEINGLQERIEQVAQMGGEIDEDIVNSYQGRSTATFVFWVSVFFGIAACVVNGNLLNLFFRDAFQTQVFGIPASVLVSIGFILAEMLLGMGTAYAKHKQWYVIQYLCAFTIVCAALFEAVVFGLVSNGFDLDVALIDEHPILRFWMAPLGLIFVTATFVIGYILHQSRHEIDEHKAALRLRREIKALNDLIRELPRHWDGIRAKAQTAEAAINEYVDSLGNKSGALSGAVDAIRTEREALNTALARAKVDEWRNWLDGADGDARLYRAANVGLAIVTIVCGGGFFAGVEQLFQDAYPESSSWVAIFTACVATAVPFGVGLLALARIQTVRQSDTRVYPHRAEPWQQGLAAVLTGILIVGLLFMTVRAGGGAATPRGLLLIGGALALAVLGYYFDRAIFGTLDLVVIVLRGLFGIVAVVFTTVLRFLLWIVVVLLMVAHFILAVIAFPWEEWIIPWVTGRGAQREPNAQRVL